jgi:DNA polymerase
MEANDLISMRQQLLIRLRHLRNAGIEWFPPAPPIEIRAVSEHTQVASAFDIAPVMEADSGATVEERTQALQVLGTEVSGCSRCTELCASRTQTVFGQGMLGAEVCFVGEAPGADEDAQGLPFVGAAGQLLNRILAASGFKREEVYICNILKCRPPGNRTPLADEAANCREYLERQLALVKPKYIVALGGCAATNLLQTTLSLGKLRGRFHDYQGIPVMVTYHPAYLLPHRHPEVKRDVWEDMKMLLKKIGRSIPEKEKQPGEPPA